ncbi:EamA family transporter [Martelella alba]|uniref:DMT family transporter n=1 Tax=Martelella alba TaxID=2590451 RepID=A0ABY2SP85_9HYPH|nr:DMT family transporter [Martelella alba]TKI07807.1 DMT family transporter [Martelella alba]
MPPSAVNRLVPFLMILGSITSLCIGTSLAKAFLFPLAGPAGTTALRTGFSAMLLLALWRPWQRTVRRRDMTFIVLYGLTLGTMNLLFYMALNKIPFGLAVAIEFIGPLTVTLLYSRRGIDFIWIALAAAGILLILPLHGNRSGLSLSGVVFALGAAFCWALYIVFGKRVSHLHSGQTVSIGLAFASLITIPAGIREAGALLVHPSLLAMGLLIALISSSLPMSLEMAALRRLPQKSFGILVSMEPAVAAIIGFFMLAETLTPVQSMAIVLSIAAGVGSAITARGRHSEADSLIT